MYDRLKSRDVWPNSSKGGMFDFFHVLRVTGRKNNFPVGVQLFFAKSGSRDFQNLRPPPACRARKVTPKVQEIARYGRILLDNERPKDSSPREIQKLDWWCCCVVVSGSGGVVVVRGGGEWRWWEVLVSGAGGWLLCGGEDRFGFVLD